MSAVATTGVISGGHRRTYQAGVVNILRGYALVQGAADSQVVLATAANAPVFAIAEDSTANVGDPVSAILDREAVAIAGAAVAAGQWVISDATARLVPTAASGDNIVGRALSSATAAGDEFVIFLNPSIR